MLRTAVTGPLCFNRCFTERDLEEPPEPVRAAVEALEALKAQLAKVSSGSARMTCIQESITALFGTLFAAGGCWRTASNATGPYLNIRIACLVSLW